MEIKFTCLLPARGNRRGQVHLPVLWAGPAKYTLNLTTLWPPPPPFTSLHLALAPATQAASSSRPLSTQQPQRRNLLKTFNGFHSTSQKNLKCSLCPAPDRPAFQLQLLIPVTPLRAPAAFLALTPCSLHTARAPAPSTPSPLQNALPSLSSDLLGADCLSSFGSRHKCHLQPQAFSIFRAAPHLAL